MSRQMIFVPFRHFINIRAECQISITWRTFHCLERQWVSYQEITRHESSPDPEKLNISIAVFKEWQMVREAAIRARQYQLLVIDG